MSKGHFRGADQSFEFWLNSERELMVGWVHDDGMPGDAATLSYTDIVALKALLDDPELWDGYSGGCPRPAPPANEARPRLIGLAGRAGSGKSTAAAWLVRERGAVEVSLAAPLKRLAMEVFGFSEEQCFGTQADKEAKDPCVSVRDDQIAQALIDVLADGFPTTRLPDIYCGRHVSPREMLIRLGDGARRHIAPDVWIRALFTQVAALPPGTLAVCSDVRYGNEAEALFKAGALVIRLNCPDAATSVDRNAPSERSVDEIDPKWLAADLTIARSPGAAELLAAFERTFSGIELAWEGGVR